MNYDDAVKMYEQNPTKEALSDAVDALVKEMTLQEKIRMLSGHAMRATAKGVLKEGRVYNATPYEAGGCGRLKIPKVMFADGPRGVVIGKSTCFPVSMLRGAAFDDALEYRVGEVFAKEAIAGGANYFAGICINLLRNPLWGRAQETYGEDPYLLGRMGAALTKAVQDKGVIACPKHFALNSIEDLRFLVNAKADGRTLHDVYLPHFKKCIDAGALSVMGAYNKVNGIYCCENEFLLKTVLRDMWGFDGFVISDFFFGIYDCARSIKAGLDVEMPYTFRYRFIKSALKKGKLNESDIDVCVKNIIGALIRILPKKQEYSKDVIVCREHTELAYETAAKGMVLLKNNGVLPLEKGKKIALVGRYADKINTGDHGSSNVYSPYTVTPYQGLKNVFGEENISLYGGNDTAKAVLAAKGCDTVIVCVGSDYRDEGEFLVNVGKVRKKPKGMGGDRTDARISKEDAAVIKALYRSGKNVIVNIMGGSAYVISDWKDEAHAVLMSFYSGIEGGRALADIISGKVNPSGKLPFTVASDEKDYPPFRYIGERVYDIDYGYYHGYTLFEKRGIKPDYPFGFGLSYTSFETSSLSVKKNEGQLDVCVKVKNTGEKDGDTVIQIYCGSQNKEADRPVKLLKGFRRVTLKAKESQTVKIEIPYDELKFFDESSRLFVIDGEYTVYAGLDCESANSLKKTVKL